MKKQHLLMLATHQLFFFANIRKKLFNIINELNPNKRTDPCEVPAQNSKDGEQLWPHLMFFINECLSDCVIPAMISRAIKTSIFKENDIIVLVNFRHISITASFCYMLKKSCAHKSEVKVTVGNYYRGFNLEVDVWYQNRIFSNFP